MFTKALGPQRFEKLRGQLGVKDVVDVVKRQMMSPVDPHEDGDERTRELEFWGSTSLSAYSLGSCRFCTGPSAVARTDGTTCCLLLRMDRG